MPDFKTFLDEWCVFQERHPEQRVGQAAYNVAYHLWGREPVLDFGTADPFYNDDNLPAFLNLIYRRYG